MEAPSGERLRGKRQEWCLLPVKLCDPCLSALEWFVYHARRYTSARLFFAIEVCKETLKDKTEMIVFRLNAKIILSWHVLL